jgi:hypothetical protein
MSLMAIESFVATLLFAAIFLFGGRMHATRSPRAALSAGAGASTAYVFVHLLPELGEAGAVFVRETANLPLPFPELRVYVSALAGFTVFYGLEHLVARSREERLPEGPEQGHERRVFLLHIGGFTLYGGLVSYLMVRGITESPTPIALYAVAMGLHFLSADHALLREHGADYTRIGRFMLAGAVVAGWSLAMLVEIPKPILITGLGLVSGGVVVNSAIMELPSEKDGRFGPFLVGAAAYTAVLLLAR